MTVVALKMIVALGMLLGVSVSVGIAGPDAAVRVGAVVGVGMLDAAVAVALALHRLIGQGGVV